jgi:outer membrane protein X
MRTKIAAFIAVAALGSTARAEAQNYQPVRIDTTLVIAYAAGDVSAYGGGIAIEPKYNLTDQLAVGLRFEAAGMVNQSIAPSLITGVELSMSARAAVSFLAKADYYLTTSSTRPFLGLGAGFYNIGRADSGTSGATAEAFRGFGLFPQFGVNFGHFRMAVGYHVLLGGEQTLVVAGVPTNLMLTKNYVAFDIGGTFGGARTTPEAQ